MLKATCRVLAIIVAGLWLSPPLEAADAALAARWVAYGQQLYAGRQYDSAIAAFASAARADGGDASAWKGLGNAYYSKGDFAQAIKYYKVALKLDPADAGLAQFVQTLSTSPPPAAPAPDALTLAGRYYKARQYDAAIQQYNAALALDPGSSVAYLGLGNCHYAKNERALAVPAYRRALELDPQNAALKAFLARYDPAAVVPPGPPDWTQPLWRSAVLPGWGQSYNREPVKGWIEGGVTLGLLAGSVVTLVVGENARNTYQTQTDPQADYDTPYSTWKNMADMNHVLVVSFLAAYTFQLADAIMNAKPMLGPGAQGPQPVQLGYLPQVGGLGVSVRALQF